MFFIKCWNRHATSGNKTNPMKSLSACDSCHSNFFWADSRDTCTKKFQKDQELQRVLTILQSGDQNLSKKQGISRPTKRWVAQTLASTLLIVSQLERESHHFTTYLTVSREDNLHVLFFTVSQKSHSKKFGLFLRFISSLT